MLWLMQVLHGEADSEPGETLDGLGAFIFSQNELSPSLVRTTGNLSWTAELNQYRSSLVDYRAET